MMRIEKAEQVDAKILHELAHAIWVPTYQNILTPQQLSLMLEKSYTVPALEESMRNGTDYFIGYQEEHRAIGFIAIRPIEHRLRIEKLYLLPQMHGHGFGRQLIDLATHQAISQGITTLELNVNRENPAFAFYKKVGFSVTQEVDIPYFGFVLNDYIMRKELVP